MGMARQQCAFAAVLLLCSVVPSLHGAAVKLVPVMEQGAVSVGCTSNVRCTSAENVPAQTCS